MRVFAVAAAIVAASLGLSACSSTTPSSQPGPIRVVASTNVWGSVAQAVGGDLVSVVSIIGSPSKDPHEYAVSARNQLEVSRAQVVIRNGGGYDDFVGTMLAAVNNPELVVVTAVDASGHAADAELNEHVWFDFAGVAKVVAKMSSVFARVDPKHAAVFEANAAAFDTRLDGLVAVESQLRASYAGVGVAITEPVPLYLLDAIGLVNKTPAAFSKAIEDGTDASPIVMRTMLAIFSTRSVKLLVYNEQTTGAETQAVIAAAQANDIAVVPVTETVPSGKDYVSWMTDILDHITEALQK